VKVPYLAFCVVFVLLAVVFSFIRLPAIQSAGGHSAHGMGALRVPHVRLGMLAIFMYVGGEVSVGSAIISFLGQPDIAGLNELDASKYVSIFWGGLMIGRFMGAVELSTVAVWTKRILLAVIPAIGFVGFWMWRGWGAASSYWPFLVLCWLAFQAGKSLAGRSLMIFSGLAVLLLATAVVVGGKVSMWCVLGVGLFSSIGWSNTFSLAIEGLGPLKSQASSLLVMAVLGGAILPPIQGRIADLTHKLRLSFIVPMLAYAYVAFYGWKGHRVGRVATPPVVKAVPPAVA
jgi:FHS family L-fucose permease-like MFS transporter